VRASKTPVLTYNSGVGEQPGQTESDERDLPTGSARWQSRHDKLDSLLALTETSLASLQFSDLLIELLHRIREVLEVDTAAVFVLDERPRELEAWAAVGIEEEALRSARVPVGKGFTGRIALLKETLVLDQVDDGTVVSPALVAMGLRTMLGTPLLHEGKLVGVLHVGSLAERQFGPEEAELIELAAGRLAGAVRAHTLAEEQEAAEMLERSLRPSALPHVPGLSLAARYIPAERAVGGDWYDLFALPSGEVWVVTGDVAGHGLQGAIIMGRTRSALRAYAMLGGPPDEVLALTSRKLSHFEPGAMVTAICATSHPPFDRFLVCSAGHPPPVLAAPGKPARFVSVPAGPPLGVLPTAAQSSVPVSVPEGAVLVLYTDGLVERRGEILDTGLELLRSTVTTGHPQMVCNTVAERLIGPRPPRDDVALVAVRRDEA
jgi:phosphoserine phosphatase RsbU/P